MELNAMTESYLVAALWSTTDDEDEPLDANYSIEDIAPESIKAAMADCELFEEKAGELLEGMSREGSEVRDRVGFDFWLTRNGHGAGFWDGDYEKEVGRKLTEISEEFGESNLYVGDDGKLYLNP